MIQCIFHKWLKRQLQNLIFMKFRRNPEFIFQNILITKLLDLKITPDVCFFFLHTDIIFSLTQRRPEKIRQGGHHHDHFLFLPCLCKPDNGIQRII